MPFSSHSTPGCSVNDPARLKALADYKIIDTGYETAFDGLVKLTALVCETPIALISLVEESRQWFKAEHGLGVRETPIDQSICRHAMLEEDVLVINDTLNDPRTIDNPLVCGRENNLRFYAGALLKSGAYPLGALCVLDYQPRTLRPEQLEALKLIREQVMHLLDMRRHNLHQRHIVQELDEARNSLQRQAHLDPLTGLLNRRAIEKRLLFELESPDTPPTPCAVMLLDLNDFKQINDVYGHLSGDRALKHIAHLMHKSIRSTDILGRWGGDEFLVIMPNTTTEQARSTAERIAESLAENPLSGTAGHSVGVSIGIVSAQSYRSVPALLQAADAAMYRAKRSDQSHWHIALDPDQ